MSEEIEQLLLFPEMDPFKTKIKGIDYIDLSQIETPNQRQSEYSLLPKGRFFLFKIPISLKPAYRPAPACPLLRMSLFLILFL